MPLLSVLLALAGLSAIPAATAPAAVPAIEGNALDGSAVQLPGPASARGTVLVMGFSEKSSGEAAAWARRLEAAPWSSGGPDFYEVPVLEGLPRLLRGVVVSAIRRQIPPAARGHVVPVFSGEQDWRSAAHVTSDRDVYLLVMDRNWHVRWSGSGEYSDALFAKLSQEVKTVQK